MIIRTASRDDLETIASIEKECFPPAEAATKEQFEERLKYYSEHIWLLFEDDKLVSFTDGMVTDSRDLTDEMFEDANLHNELGDWQMIFGVNTLPSYRRKGYASALIRRVIDDARKQNRQGVVLTCEDKLIEYYEKFGFVNEGKTDKSCIAGIEWNQMRITFDR